MDLTKKRQELLFGFLDVLYSKGPLTGESARCLIMDLCSDPKEREFALFLKGILAAEETEREEINKLSKTLTGSASIEDRINRFCKYHGLSRRELELIHTLFKGYAPREAASFLGINAGTYKNHLYSIFNKTGVDSKAHLLYRIIRFGQRGNT